MFCTQHLRALGCNTNLTSRRMAPFCSTQILSTGSTTVAVTSFYKRLPPTQPVSTTSVLAATTVDPSGSRGSGDPAVGIALGIGLPFLMIVLVTVGAFVYARTHPETMSTAQGGTTATQGAAGKSWHAEQDAMGSSDYTPGYALDGHLNPQVNVDTDDEEVSTDEDHTDEEDQGQGDDDDYLDIGGEADADVDLNASTRSTSCREATRTAATTGHVSYLA